MEDAPLQLGGVEELRVQLLPLERVEGSDSGAIRELEERASGGAALIVRERVLGLIVIELLISVE